MSAQASRVVFALCAAEVLTMAGVFAFPALLPGFIAEWGLTNTEAGWISGITFAGYAVAVPVLTAATDRIDARRVHVAGALVAAVSALGFAATAGGFISALLWRALGGVGLAGTYMPGLKALVDRTSGPSQPRWISFYTACFSLGTSASFLVSGWVAGPFGWRAAFWLAGGLAAAAAVLVLALVWPMAPQPVGQPAGLLDFRPVFRNRAAMGYVLGYAAHMWELFGLRNWIVAFLAFAATLAPGPAWPAPTAAATLSALVAMATSIGGADLAVRIGRRRLCAWAMVLSAAMALGIGFAAGLPYGLVVALALVYAGLVQADSAALTTGAVLEAEPARRGATIAVHSLLGFAAAFLGPLAFGVVLDAAGGAGTARAWGLAFASLGLVAALGPLFILRR
ncbi:MAG: MFS transporter [Actinomycetota bacterium]